MNEGQKTTGKQFVAVEGKPSEEIPAVPFIGIAYGFIWIVVLGYLLYLAGGLGRVRRQIADLQKKLDGK